MVLGVPFVLDEDVLHLVRSHGDVIDEHDHLVEIFVENALLDADVRPGLGQGQKLVAEGLVGRRHQEKRQITGQEIRPEAEEEHRGQKLVQPQAGRFQHRDFTVAGQAQEGQQGASRVDMGTVRDRRKGTL